MPLAIRRLLVAACVLLTAREAWAQIPRTISYQGVLADAVAANGVGTAAVADLAITNAKIANNTIAPGKIATTGAASSGPRAPTCLRRSCPEQGRTAWKQMASSDLETGGQGELA
jgi:hypothetical protein